jgi:type I restriction enzyme S subunit
MKISDIADIINLSEKDPANSGIDVFVGLEHYDIAEPVIKRFGSTKMLSTAAKKFEAGDVLIARRNVYLQRASVAKFSGLTSGDSIILRVKKELHTEETDCDTMCQLLPFILNSINFWDYANTNADGTMSKRLSPAMLQEYEFSLPSLAEQKVLAEKLWAAYEVKQSYLKMIAATEEMVKAQFIEMFGDHENGDDWLKITVEDAIKKGYIARPLDGNHGEKHPKGDDYVSEGVPFIMAQDLKEKKVDFANCHFITEAQSKTLTKGWAKTGDVLLTHKGTIGRVAIVQPSQYESLLLTPQITYYRCLCKINNEYLAAYFATDYFMKQLKGMITGSTRASVTITQQEKLLLIIPPMDMQIRFVDIVNQADKSVCELRKSIDAIDKVIKSLINENL